MTTVMVMLIRRITPPLEKGVKIKSAPHEIMIKESLYSKVINKNDSR